MAHAYTPGLRVSEFTLLSKDRRLPLLGEVLVEIMATVFCCLKDSADFSQVSGRGQWGGKGGVSLING